MSATREGRRGARPFRRSARRGGGAGRSGSILVARRRRGDRDPGARPAALTGRAARPAAGARRRPKGATTGACRRGSARNRASPCCSTAGQHANHARRGAKKIELGGDAAARRNARRTAPRAREAAALFPGKIPAGAGPAVEPHRRRRARRARRARADRPFDLWPGAGRRAASGQHASRHFRMAAGAAAALARRSLRASRAEIERRLAADDEPIGILTHHLVHEEAELGAARRAFRAARRATGGALAGDRGALRRLTSRCPSARRP